MRASAEGAAFFMMWRSTRRPVSPFAASAETNSIDRISRTLARTKRLTTPMGMRESVTTGRIRGLTCSQLEQKPEEPRGQRELALVERRAEHLLGEGLLGEDRGPEELFGSLLNTLKLAL